MCILKQQPHQPFHLSPVALCILRCGSALHYYPGGDDGKGGSVIGISRLEVS